MYLRLLSFAPLLALAVFLLLGHGAETTVSQTGSVSTDVTVAARVTENGNIEVAIDHGDGLVFPSARFLTAPLEPSDWRRSSPVRVSFDVPDQPVREVEVERVVERVVEVEVPVEVPVEVEVEKPVDRLSVRPSDFDDWLICLTEETEDGHVFMTSDSEITTYGVASLLYEAGKRYGLVVGGGPLVPAHYAFRHEHERQWFLQCASYHGHDHRHPSDYAVDQDDWKN